MSVTSTGWGRGISSSYPADPDTVLLVRRLVADLAAKAGAKQERLDAVRLAVSEAATNAVLHAYQDSDTPGEIHLGVNVRSGEMTVLIADDGCGLGEPARVPGLGWGLKLIADACDSLTVAPRRSGGIEMRMRFRLCDPDAHARERALAPPVTAGTVR